MKKIASLLLIVPVAITLAACSKTPSGDPQTILNKAWEKLAEKNAGYKAGEMKVSGKANLEIEGNKAELSGTGDVLFDSSDEKNIKSAIKADLKGSGELEGKKAKVDFKGEIRMLEKTLFVLVENLNIDAGDPQTNMMANLVGNLYKNQWIALPSDTVETPEAVGLDSFTSEKMAEIAKKHHFFEVKQDLGGGKYEVVVNVEKLKAYLMEIGESNETPLTPEDLEAIESFFKSIEYTFQVQIDDDYDVTWVKGNVQAKDEIEQQELNITFEGNTDDNETDGKIDLIMTGTTPGKLSAEFNLEHEEKSVSIEKPEDAQDFDLGSMLGAGLGEMPEGLEDTSMEGLEQ